MVYRPKRIRLRRRVDRWIVATLRVVRLLKLSHRGPSTWSQGTSGAGCGSATPVRSKGSTPSRSCTRCSASTSPETTPSSSSISGTQAASAARRSLPPSRRARGAPSSPLSTARRRTWRRRSASRRSGSTSAPPTCTPCASRDSTSARASGSSTWVAAAGPSRRCAPSWCDGRVRVCRPPSPRSRWWQRRPRLSPQCSSPAERSAQTPRSPLTSREGWKRDGE
mmetsp:Transcript_40004/g.95053  ORF Transcript_40004/g.95053 Transcript_40004/m.95053 type:complete len:223 (+) Transcript_40004:297-965(+)